MDGPLQLLLVLLATLTAPGPQGEGEGAREAFEEAAGRLEAIDYGDVLHGRVGTPAAFDSGGRDHTEADDQRLLAQHP